MLCQQAWSAQVQQPAAPWVMAAATSLTSKFSENACDDSFRMCFCSHRASTVRMPAAYYTTPQRYNTSSHLL